MQNLSYVAIPTASIPGTLKRAGSDTSSIYDDVQIALVRGVSPGPKGYLRVRSSERFDPPMTVYMKALSRAGTCTFLSEVMPRQGFSR